VQSGGINAVAMAIPGIELLLCFLVASIITASPPKPAINTLIGISLLGGIGFTMSLFIRGLASIKPEYVDQAKYGMLIASILAGLAGSLVYEK